MNDTKNILHNVTGPMGKDAQMLNDLQRETFDYFIKEVNPVTGLITDKTQPDAPSSIAVVGMGLSAYIIGIEKHFLSREDAIKRVLKVLRFFYNSPQGTQPDATGYKGFYYHFIDMVTGKRAWQSELSTIDTALLMAGVLSVRAYFKGADNDEAEIRRIADELYKRIDWQWACNGRNTLTHGWYPETGFIKFRWNRDYNEGLVMYMMALGSPTYPIKKVGCDEWTATFKVSPAYGIDYLYAGPLFIHQFSHMWIDFRGIHDDFNRRAGFDYFENSKRATHVHQQYAIDNPKKFEHYGEFGWGLTASDGPGKKLMKINGKSRSFFDYIARGAPYGPDDGTISPWAVVASLPFAPEIVIDTIRHAIEKLNLKHHRLYGFDASYNPSCPDPSGNPNGWVSPWRFGLNQGPIVIMIENYHTGLLWEVMKQCPYMVKGLQAAGFTDGWLENFKEGGNSRSNAL